MHLSESRSHAITHIICKMDIQICSSPCPTSGHFHSPSRVHSFSCLPVLCTSEAQLHPGVSVTATPVTDTPVRASVEGRMAGSGRDEWVGLVPENTPKRGEMKSLKRLWQQRPFARVVKGFRAYQTVRDYIQLNEQETLGHIPYRSQRLKGLSSSEWEILWS